MPNIIFTILITLSLFGCANSEKTKATQNASYDESFSITPSAPIYAEALISDSGTISLAKVEKITNPKITFTFEFSEFNGGMMLSAKNPLNQAVKYHLDMIDYNGKLHNTSSCPVIADGMAFESWPHPIPEIRVSNIHFTSKSEEGKCVY